MLYYFAIHKALYATYITTSVFYRSTKRSYSSIRLDSYISIRGIIIDYKRLYLLLYLVKYYLIS